MFLPPTNSLCHVPCRSTCFCILGDENGFICLYEARAGPMYLMREHPYE